MDIGLITLLMFGGLFLLLALKVPLAFATGTIAMAVGYAVMGPRIFPLFPSSVYSIVTNYVYVALPMFIFMGAVLERSGISDDLYDAIYHWMGSIKGSLAIATIAAAMILSAMIGNMGAVVCSMGVIALPAMKKRGYDLKMTMVIVIILGMIIEWIGIIMLTVPIFVPIILRLGFGPLWFAMLMAVNLQMDVLTPPFGYALFYMKGVAPKGTTTLEIYRAAYPFCAIQLLCA